MNNQEIIEKYGVEIIAREMWVWDERPEDAFFTLVMYKIVNCLDFPYMNFLGAIFKNASDTNPNEAQKPQEPKVGDVGYFWNEDKVFYAYGVLEGIDKEDVLPYLCEGLSWHVHFSHKKQPWMK